jgi:hypothetical protein
MAHHGAHSLELAAAPELDDDGHAPRTGTHKLFSCLAYSHALVVVLLVALTAAMAPFLCWFLFARQGTYGRASRTSSPP